MTVKLAINDLHVEVGATDQPTRILHGVTLHLERGAALGIVGESGCGKSTTLLAAIGLQASAMRVSGEILLDGQNLVGLDENKWARIRGQRIACVFQNARGSVHPMMRVGQQIIRVWRAHTGKSRSAAASEMREILLAVGFPDPDQIATRYPHQLSGGQCQRVMIALALIMRPDVLVADEPTSGLDVSIRDEVLGTLRARCNAFGTTMLLISHDLHVIEKTCGSVAIMYAGEIVEQGDTATVFARPRHPYTIGLLNSMKSTHRRMGFIAGSVPNPAERVEHCAFASRCPHVQGECRRVRPPLRSLGDKHTTRCLFDIAAEGNA